MMTEAIVWVLVTVAVTVVVPDRADPLAGLVIETTGAAIATGLLKVTVLDAEPVRALLSVAVTDIVWLASA
jgi:hypothetical protein